MDGVLHSTPQGPVFIGLNGVTVGPDVVTIDATSAPYPSADGKLAAVRRSLGIFTAFKAPVSWFSWLQGQITFTAGELLDKLVRWYLGLRASTPSCSPDITTNYQIHTSGSVLDVANVWNDVPLKYCVVVPGGAGGIAGERRGVEVSIVEQPFGQFCSARTWKPVSVWGPNDVISATSTASRPRPTTTRPTRGALFRASNVCQRPSRYASNQAAKSIRSYGEGTSGM
jgi:hypothetical protein